MYHGNSDDPIDDYRRYELSLLDDPDDEWEEEMRAADRAMDAEQGR